MQTAIQPSPDLFFETIQAYQRTAALKAALELDVFTAIGEGAQSVSAPGGDAFTLRELTGMLEAAGFSQVTAHPLPGPLTVIVGTN